MSSGSSSNWPSLLCYKHSPYSSFSMQGKAHYVQAHQRILNWCHGFYEHATKIVKAGYEEYKFRNLNATTAKLKKWATDAVDPDKRHAF